MIKHFLAVLAVLPLAGCSSGPSESEMNEAVRKKVDRNNKQLEAAVGGALGSANQDMLKFMKTVAPEVKKISCKEDGRNAYLCDIALGDGGHKTVVPARFVKASDGWEVVQ